MAYTSRNSQRVITMTTSNRIPDRNGFIEIKDNPITKVGVFPYSGRTVRGDDPNKIYMVYRPEEELNNPDTIASFRLLPLINDHPADLLGQQAMDKPNVDGKPAEGVIGEQVHFRDGYLLGNLKLYTDRINDAIDSGKRELSAGFRCLYEKASGVFDGVAYDYIQRNIRGNHLALVDAGRMGSDVAVLDHLTLTYDAKELFKMADEDNKDTTTAAATDEATGAEMTIAELSATVKTIVPALAEIQKMLAGLASPPATTTVVDEADPNAALVAMDARIKALETENAALKANAGNAMDSKDVLALFAKREALYKGVSKHTGAFDYSAMDALDVAKYGIDKLGLGTVAAGHEITAIETYLAAKDTPSIAMDRKTTKANPITAYVAASNA
jgi:hypothetical protein